MSNWQRNKLKDVVSVWIRGSTPNRSHIEYYSEEQETPWARACF